MTYYIPLFINRSNYGPDTDVLGIFFTEKDAIDKCVNYFVDKCLYERIKQIKFNPNTVKLIKGNDIEIPNPYYFTDSDSDQNLLREIMILRCNDECQLLDFCESHGNINFLDNIWSFKISRF